jgi:hypothetical protein
MAVSESIALGVGTDKDIVVFLRQQRVSTTKGNP